MSKHTPGPWRPSDSMLESLDPLCSDARLTLEQRECVEGAIVGLHRLVAQRDELLEALRECLPHVEEMACEHGYGFARPANPHDFHPDPECCSPEEIAAHKAACDAYDRGEYDRSADPTSIRGPGFHLLRAPWGIGSYTHRDARMSALIERCRAAIAKATGEA